MIFLDTNGLSESLRKSPDPAVIAWLIRYDAELAHTQGMSDARFDGRALVGV